MRFDVPMISELYGGKECIAVCDETAFLDIEGMSLVTPRSARSAPPMGDDRLYLCDERTFHELASSSTLPKHVAVASISEDSARIIATCLREEGHGTQALLAWPEQGLPELGERVGTAIRRLESWDTRMLETAVMGRNAVEVLRVGAEMLTNPVALFDQDSVLMGYAGAFPDDYQESVWGEVVDKGRAPIYFLAPQERREARAWLTRERRPFRVGPVKKYQQENRIITVMLGDVPYQTLAQTAVCSPFTLGQESFLMTLRDRLQLLAGSVAGGAKHPNGAAHCLRMVLDGYEVAPSLIGYYIRERGWQTDDELELLLCPAPSDDGSSVEKGAYQMAVHTALPKALVIAYEDSIVAVYRRCDHNPLDRKVERRLLSGFGEEYQTLGLSTRFFSLLDSRSAYRQARHAFEEASRRGLKGIFSFDSLFQAHVFHSLERTDTLKELGHPVLARMLTGDVGEPREALTELYAYLIRGGNITRAAEDLNMHRNTLEYHIKGLERNLNLDLRSMSEEETFRLELSCVLALEELRKPGKSL